MQLPSIKRLDTDDFKGEEKWIGRLLSPLNQFFTAMTNGLLHGITFQDNIACQIQTVSFNNNSAELSSSHPIQFLLGTINSSPTGVLIVNAQDTSTTPQSLSGAPFATWTYKSSKNQIAISAITGLVAGQTYSITFLVF